MPAKLDYRWNLRKVMAERGMFSTTELIEPLAERGITLSSSQVYRLVVERPERLSLKILMSLLDILECRMDDLIEPVSAADTSARPRKKAAAGGSAEPPAAALGSLRPKRARITGGDR
ncbi:helix-turn-helix domain-containing protein [Kitasatospora sp. NPDC001095]